MRSMRLPMPCAVSGRGSGCIWLSSASDWVVVPARRRDVALHRSHEPPRDLTGFGEDRPVNHFNALENGLRVTLQVFNIEHPDPLNWSDGIQSIWVGYV